MIYFQQCKSAAILALQLWEKNLQNLKRLHTGEQKAISQTQYIFTYIMLHTHATYRAAKTSPNPLYS